MSFTLLPQELMRLRLLPDKDIAGVAAELDMIPPAQIDRKALLEEIMPRLLARARAEGLPLSKFDRGDLEALPEPHREALARCMGCKSSPRAMIRAGSKVYKIYTKERRSSQIPLVVPLFLEILARCAAESAS